jgi:hypothetical protein
MKTSFLACSDVKDVQRSLTIWPYVDQFFSPAPAATGAESTTIFALTQRIWCFLLNYINIGPNWMLLLASSPHE